MEELICRGAEEEKLSIHNALKGIGQEGVVTGNSLININIQAKLEVSLLQQQPCKSKNLWNEAKIELNQAQTKITV